MFGELWTRMLIICPYSYLIVLFPTYTGGISNVFVKSNNLGFLTTSGPVHRTIALSTA